MKVVLPGGAGHLGQVLTHALAQAGHEVVILTRSPGDRRHHPPAKCVRLVSWDGRTPESHWTAEVDGSDAVINLAGRSVNCRYTPGHLREMLDSRIDSTRAVGQAISRASCPPPVWLQKSTATIYAHRYDAPNDEATGQIGGSEPDAPVYWRKSIEIATAWEATLAQADTPRTRKVALRTAMVMSAQPGGVFDVLYRLAKYGLGGPIAGGRQYVSWIHEQDFVRAVAFLLARTDLDGPVSVTAPNPLPQRDFMAALREAVGVPIGLPATRWMAEAGAFVMRTDTELVLKSRRVVPQRLLGAGFAFDFPTWPDAARDLVARKSAGPAHELAMGGGRV